MAFKDTINGMVRPKLNEEGVDNSGMIFPDDTNRKTDRAAISKSRSRIENVQYNDLNIEIDQRDIDRAAKKYHKEIRSRRKEQKKEGERSQLQHRSLSASSQVLFTEIQEQNPEMQDIQPSFRLWPHLRHQNHKRPQMANTDHARRQRTRETENLDSLEPTGRRLKQKKKPVGSSRGHLDDRGSLTCRAFHTQEELSKEATHKHIGSPKQLRLKNDQREQNANDELSHRTRKCQKHPIRQYSLLETLEISSEPEGANRRQRRQKQQRQQEPVQDSTTRQRHQHNHEKVQDLQGEESWILETVPVPDPVPVPHSRHNGLRLPQANRVQANRIQSDRSQFSEAQRSDHMHLLEDSPEISSRQRRQRHLVQQHGPPDSPIQSHAADSESRLSHILHQQLPHSHQGFHPEMLQRRLRSPINEVGNEGLQVCQRRPRIQNSPRILHPSDRIPFSEDNTPKESPTQEDLPPSDEYYAGNEAEIPPYHATLHKYLDLISYDPRVVPCLRVNRALIKSNDKLSESIFQFLKFNLFPESIDPWEISHIDDQHYDDLIPELIPVETDSSDVLPSMPYEPHYGHHNNVIPQIISDDDYEYALYLSSLENNVHNHNHNMNIGSTIRG